HNEVTSPSGATWIGERSCAPARTAGVLAGAPGGGQGFQPLPSSIVYCVLPGSMISSPGTVYLVGGPFPPLGGRSSIIEYLPMGIQVIWKEPSLFSGIPKVWDFSWRDTCSVTCSPSGKDTGSPSRTTRPLNASTVGPSNSRDLQPATVSPNATSTATRTIRHMDYPRIKTREGEESRGRTAPGHVAGNRGAAVRGAKRLRRRSAYTVRSRFDKECCTG